MEITGKIIQALPEVSGTSQRGNSWKKREYVLETQETYPKKVFFDFFGERADQFPLTVGQEIKLSFDIESREYNGRWFVSIRGWKAEPVTTAAPGTAMPGATQAPGGYGAYPGAPAAFPGAPAAPAAFPAAPAPGAVPPPPAMPEAGATDDLPF